mmetsp:Transcript_9472/g.8339  ORF Transcript_9472/g.8339 Transcript_9472/m.8339 type:complete len:204 (+) Transcript_9472:464-1075(+)
MTLNKALKADESSEISETELKQLNIFKSFYNEAQGKNMQIMEAKGRLKQLLSKRSLYNESAPSPTGVRRNLESLNKEDNMSEESVNDDAYFVKNSEGYHIEIITDEMKAKNNGEGCLKKNPINFTLLCDSDSTSHFNEKSKIKKCSSSNTKQIDSLVEVDDLLKLKNDKKKNRLESLKGCIQDFKMVLKLQKIVKKWLIKRQA